MNFARWPPIVGDVVVAGGAGARGAATTSAARFVADLVPVDESRHGVEGVEAADWLIACVGGAAC